MEESRWLGSSSMVGYSSGGGALRQSGLAGMVEKGARRRREEEGKQGPEPAAPATGGIDAWDIAINHWRRKLRNSFRKRQGRCDCRWPPRRRQADHGDDAPRASLVA